MALISGTFQNDARLVNYEASQQGDCWTVTVRCAAQHYESRTWQPSPWACIEKLVGEALDDVQRVSEKPSLWDMNQKLAKPAKPTPLRRRGSLPPGSVPEWRPPETD
jgi:hypothetical protein